MQRKAMTKGISDALCGLFAAVSLLVNADSVNAESDVAPWQVPALDPTTRDRTNSQDMPWLPEGLTRDEYLRVARELARQGLRAGAKGDCTVAVRQLESAYAICPDAAVLPQLVAALERLGRHAAAAERLHRYLDSTEEIDGASIQRRSQCSLGVSDSEIPDRATLERRYGELSSRYAQLTIESDPPGAWVLLDERRRGATPLSLVLDRGLYRVALLHGEYHEHRQTVEVHGGEPARIEARLDPLVEPSRGEEETMAQPAVLALPSPRFQWNMGWEVALWATTGLTAVSGSALAVTAKRSHHAVEEYQTSPQRLADAQHSVKYWRHWTHALIAATATMAATAVTLATWRLLERLSCRLGL